MLLKKMRLVQQAVDPRWNGDFWLLTVESELPCQITDLFLVLIIKLKLLLHIDSSGCALVLSPI